MVLIHMNRSRVWAAVVCTIFVFSLVLVPLASADWTMFGSNPSRSAEEQAIRCLLLQSFGVTYPWFCWISAVVNGVVYIGSGDNDVYALNAVNGDKLWSYATNGEAKSSPAVVDGVVYILSNDGNIYSLNATNGAFLWSYAIGIFSSGGFTMEGCRRLQLSTA